MSYAATNLGTFIAIIAISNKISSDEINDYTGMGKRAPLLALALSFCLISSIRFAADSGAYRQDLHSFSGACTLWLAVAGYRGGDKQCYLGFLLLESGQGDVDGNSNLAREGALVLGIAYCFCLSVPSSCF